MAFTPTNRPVPSDAPKDFYFNTGFADTLVNSDEHTAVDRTGKVRKTWAGIEADNAGLAADLAGSNGSYLVTHNDGFPGSEDVNLHQLALESLSVTRFGALGNYVIGGTGHDSTTDFQDAFNAALAQGHRAIRVPAGVYLITGEVTGEPLTLIGEVGATTIVFKNMAGMQAFKFNPASSVGRVLGSYGIEYVVEGANIDCAFKAPKNSSQYNTYFLRHFFQRNYFRGANRVPAKYSFGWDFGASRWLRLHDSVGTQISWNNFQGVFDIQTDPAGQLQDCPFELSANGAVLSARIHDNNIGPIYQAGDIGDRVFLSMHDNDCIGNMDGLVWTGTILLNEPKIHNNNFNVQRDGIKFAGPSSITVMNNTIRRHPSGWKGATHDWNAFNIQGGGDLKLVLNTVQPDESGGAFSGTMTAFKLTGVGLSVLSGNYIGVGNDIGFILDDCTGITLGDTITAQSAATDVLFDLRNGTRRTSFGTFAEVSTFSGQIIKKDSASALQPNSMINKLFDLQSTGNVTLDLTRVNAAADEKRARLVKGTTSIALQFVNDSGSAQNVAIFNQVGNSPSTVDIRGTELLTAVTRPRLNNVSTLGTSSFQWSDIFSVKGTFSGPVLLGQYTLGTLPSAAANSGRLILVTDATGGQKVCMSNGSVWQILNTTTTVT